MLLPDLDGLAPSDMRKFPLAANFPKEYAKGISSLFSEKAYFASLPAVYGSVAALKEMQAHPGLECYICTAPIVGSRYCHQEKVEWVRRHFGTGDEAEGKAWVARMVITSDKSLVRGDILIDDAPEAKARAFQPPEWEHVWFKRPYNADGTGRRHLERWADWREVILSC